MIMLVSTLKIRCFRRDIERKTGDTLIEIYCCVSVRISLDVTSIVLVVIVLVVYVLVLIYTHAHATRFVGSM